MRTAYLLFLAILSGCNGNGFWNPGPENLSLEKDFNRIEISDAFSLMVPDYMKENKELHKDASLAYGSDLKVAYVMVLEESIGEAVARIPGMDGYEDSLDLIQNYLRVNLRMSAGSLQFPEVGETRVKKINGQDAAEGSLSGHMEEKELAYHFTCVKGRERIYLIMCWTSAEKKQNFEDTFTKIAGSFELVDLVKN